MKYVNLIAGYFCIFMFAGMLLLCTYLLIAEENLALVGRCMRLLLFILPAVAMVFFLFFVFAQEANVFYCSWSIHVTPDLLTLKHDYKGNTRVIEIPREKIVRVELNRRRKMAVFANLTTYPRNFFENRDTCGIHLLLRDGTKQYLPLVSVNNLKAHDATLWLAATLNEFLAEHLPTIS